MKLNSDSFSAFVYLPSSNSSYDKASGHEFLQKLKKHINISLVTDNDPQTAQKIVNELKNGSLPADKAETNNCSQWYMPFRDLLRGNANKIDSDRQKYI